jgi:hypothetical protein
MHAWGVLPLPLATKLHPSSYNVAYLTASIGIQQMALALLSSLTTVLLIYLVPIRAALPPPVIFAPQSFCNFFLPHPYTNTRKEW